jgi:hypothetical protein
MKTIKYVSIVASFLACTVAWAGEDASMMDKPSFSASQSMVVSALVEAVDQETRVVTLRKSNGEAITFTAGDDVRNLAQVSVGDHLTAEYVETISIMVMAADGLEAEAAEVAAMARAEEGDMPGFAAMDAVVITATVEEINLEANTFKLKGPDGVINEYTARNPQNLERSAVGDLVVMTVTSAVAIVVEEKPAE